MNARDIPECLLSLRALKIDKAWFRGFTEKQLEEAIPTFIEASDYERYILVSDDTIVTQQALDNLLKLQDAGPVVTGWCNIFPGQTLANLELRPIAINRDFYLRTRDEMPAFLVPLIKWLWRKTPIKRLIDHFIYRHFPDEEEIWAQEPLFRTYFVGWSLTSISREMWLKHGFHYANTSKSGHGSDQKMSLDLAGENVVMLCARDSFIYHLGTVRNFIVGKVEPSVKFESQEEVQYANDYIH